MQSVLKPHRFVYFFNHPTFGDYYLLADNHTGVFLGKYKEEVNESIYRGRRRVVSAACTQGMLTYNEVSYEAFNQRPKTP